MIKKNPPKYIFSHLGASEDLSQSEYTNTQITEFKSISNKIELICAKVQVFKKQLWVMLLLKWIQQNNSCNTVTDVLNHIKKLETGSKLLLLAPIHLNEERDLKTLLNIFSQQGYARIKFNNSIVRIEEFPLKEYSNQSLELVIDRIVLITAT